MSEVTVLLPVYNGQNYIEESIRSILVQDMGDFELLVVDDGSVDSTPDIVSGIMDERIRLIRSDRNRGLVSALNTGIKSINTQYIARMDADDIAYPERLGTQLEYLEKNPDVGVVGSSISIIGTRETTTYPETDSAIKVAMLENSAFAHPAVMYRTQLVRAFPYSDKYLHAEDYYLWVELSGITKFANIRRPLLRYRTHLGQVSARFGVEQGDARTGILREYLSMIMGRSVDDKTLKTHFALLGAERSPDRADLECWVEELRERGAQHSLWESSDFEDFVAAKYRALSDRSIGRKILRKLIRGLSIFRNKKSD